jgi:prepilin-type N-terminal cleavage/methylation domain-containing protein
MRPAISNCQSPIRDPAGMTVVELLVVIAVAGILYGVASLALAPFLSNARLDSGVRQIATDLQLVRMQAVAQNRRLRVSFRAATRDYIVEKDEDGFWQRHLLRGHVVGPVDDATTILPPGVNITAVNSGGDVVFVPRGYVDGGITVTLRADAAARSRRVVVNLAGRVRID